MKSIVLKVRFAVKERLRKNIRKVRDAGTKVRYLIIFNVLAGRSCRETAKVLKVHHTTVGRGVNRFQEYGEAGLQDGRCDNGQDKLDEDFLQKLDRGGRKTPQDFGRKRPTWTRELLVEVIVRRTGGACASRYHIAGFGGHQGTAWSAAAARALSVAQSPENPAFELSQQVDRHVAAQRAPLLRRRG